MMRELAEITWPPPRFQRKRAVGNPDALAVKVHVSGCGAAGGFLGTSSREIAASEEDRKFRFSARVRNGYGKYTGVFVIHVAGVDAVIRSKGRQPYTLPVE